MIGAADVIQGYLEGIRRRSAAKAVSLWVPAGDEGGFGSLFVRCGDEPPRQLANAELAAEVSNSWRPDVSELRSLPTVEALPSDESGCRLFRVVVRPTAHRVVPADAPHRRRGDSVELALTSIGVLVGVRFEAGECPLPQPKEGERYQLASDSSARGQQVDSEPWWRFVLEQAGMMASQIREIAGVLSDPVTGVGGRAQLQGHLARAFARAKACEMPLSLILMSPDDFALVNQRFGHQQGDRVLREIAYSFKSGIRKSDFAARYGGAILAAVVEDADSEAGEIVAGKLLDELQGRRYLDESVTLSFRAAIATYAPGEVGVEQPLELTVRAEEALFHARRPSGQQLVHWTPELDAQNAASGETIGGFFTGNMAKDYRNMQLLAEIVRVVARSAGFDDLARKAVEKLSATLKPERIGLFEIVDGKDMRLVQGLLAGAYEGHEDDFGRRELLRRAALRGRPLVELRGFGDEEVSCCAIPMMVGDEALGGLYMEGSTLHFFVDGSDLVFFRSLASQLAVALDRAKLASQEKARQEQERSRLRAEVEGLRQAVQEANLEYRSEPMEAVMSTVRRVAPTEATVLITGESGTGKDLIARTVHRLSGRRNRPLVVVDCAAIPATLIESELFGHEKGAFSGAGQKRIGRLEQADGATVFLDEIGELPLEVQAKLLRFVQEKQLTRVGSSSTRSVDARVIAATNRDLLAEVKAQRFREDLYYRLNVVRVSLPALRERPDDVLHLAYHYLRTYSLLYSKGVVSLTPEAEAVLVGHAWPGNVRELQNRIQQAVILAEQPNIGAEDLQLDPNSSRRAAPLHTTPSHGAGEPSDFAATGGTVEPLPSGGLRGSIPLSKETAGTSDDRSSIPIAREQSLPRLRGLLGRRLDGMLENGGPLLPFGEWIADDLVLEADREFDGVASRAATSLGMAETTFRRRRSKAQMRADAGLSPRPAWWHEVRELLSVLVRSGAGGPAAGEDLDTLTHDVVLKEVAGRVEDDARAGAALLGVTPTTYRRRRERLREPAILLT